MPAIRRILVAVKVLESRAQPALLKAAQLAHALGAEVEIFHTLTTPLYADLYTYAAQGLKNIEAELHEKMRNNFGQDSIFVSAHTKEGIEELRQKMTQLIKETYVVRYPYQVKNW